MMQFGELGIELKSGIVFSIAAFFFSIIAGFAGSVPAGIVLVRSVFITPLFFGVGFGLVLVIKKFVPEVYEILSEVKKNTEDPVEKVEISLDTVDETVNEVTEKNDSSFSEFTEKDYDRLQTISEPDLDSVAGTSAVKLGKHIIVENSLNKYEPKLMAQAIRTMMSKDKD